MHPAHLPPGLKNAVAFLHAELVEPVERAFDPATESRAEPTTPDRKAPGRRPGEA